MTANMRVDRRVQFDVLPERLEEMDRLMAFCDIRTRKELFDNAITLFEWAVEVARNGNHVAEYNRTTDHVEIVRMPVIETATRRAKSHAQLPPAPSEENGSDGNEGKRTHLKVAMR